MDPKPFVMPEETAPEDMEVIDEESMEGEQEGAVTTPPDYSEGKLNKGKSQADEAQIKLFDE